MLQAARASVGVQRGLFFGAFIAIGNLLTVIGAALLAANVVGPTSGTIQGSKSLILLTVAVLDGAINLVTFALLCLAGASAYRRAGRISTGAVAGLVAGALGGLVGAVGSGVVFVISFNTLSGASSGLPLATALTTTGISILSGLILDCGVGAGLGALGALIRQSVFS